MSPDRHISFAAWLLTFDAMLYGLLYGALGMIFPAFGDRQIAPLANLSPIQFSNDPLHAVWLREIISISLTRLVLAAVIVLVASSALRSGQRWSYLVSLLFGLLLIREVFNELQTGTTFIFWTGVSFAALWLLSFALGLLPLTGRGFFAPPLGRLRRQE